MKAPRVLVIVTAVCVLAAISWGVSNSEAITKLFEPNALQELIERAGNYGPLAVVMFMAAAIIISPLPSAPIALAAGAAYGHAWGTAYILIGAEIGALAAFGIARICGREAVCRLIGERIPRTKFSTQNGLTLLVFVTRLLPFVSFDVVSYAAGLTSITLFRFAAATLAGMVPASFLLAHFGAEVRAENWKGVTIALMIVGVGMVVLAAIYAWRTRAGTRRNHGSSE